MTRPKIKDWKDDFPERIRSTMRSAGWAMQLFQHTCDGMVHSLTDDELDELERYLKMIGTGNCWWAEYEARDQMRRAIYQERRRRDRSGYGSPVVLVDEKAGRPTPLEGCG